MGSRLRKLLAAGLILAVGFGLAWPFRHDSQPPSGTPVAPAAVSPPAVSPPATTRVEPERLTGPIVLPPAADPVGPTTTPIANASHYQSQGESFASDAPPPVESPRPAPVAEVADRTVAVPSASRVDVEATQRPVYSTQVPIPAESVLSATMPELRIHVVHNGDTLARLARRYLGDDARAMEIFDLNREVLVNPHLLPIGAELEIPPSPPSPSDEVEPDA